MTCGKIFEAKTSLECGDLAPLFERIESVVDFKNIFDIFRNVTRIVKKRC